MLSRFVVVVIAGCASAGQSAGDASGGGRDGVLADAAPHGDGAVSDAAPHGDASIGACASAMTGTLAAWSFVGEPGSQAQTAASSTATGLTAAPVTRSSGLVVASGVGSINSSGWSLAATNDGTAYYTFAVTPPPGCTMDLTQLTVDTRASSTGPHSAAVGTSADAFATTTAITPTAVNNAALSVTGATGMVELRVFGWAATAAGGTLRIQNTLTLSGTLR
jgi:hypothetical protein